MTNGPEDEQRRDRGQSLGDSPFTDQEIDQILKGAHAEGLTGQNALSNNKFSSERAHEEYTQAIEQYIQKYNSTARDRAFYYEEIIRLPLGAALTLSAHPIFLDTFSFLTQPNAYRLEEITWIDPGEMKSLLQNNPEADLQYAILEIFINNITTHEIPHSLLKSYGADISKIQFPIEGERSRALNHVEITRCLNYAIEKDCCTTKDALEILLLEDLDSLRSIELKLCYKELQDEYQLIVEEHIRKHKQDERNFASACEENGTIPKGSLESLSAHAIFLDALRLLVEEDKIEDVLTFGQNVELLLETFNSKDEELEEAKITAFVTNMADQPCTEKLLKNYGDDISKIEFPVRHERTRALNHDEIVVCLNYAIKQGCSTKIEALTILSLQDLKSLREIELELCDKIQEN